jgi:hypothetical protein
MQPPPRYVPELQALAAREVARHVRSLSREDRYHYLRSIPESIRELIQAFPTDFIVWMGHECLLGYENSLGKGSFQDGAPP